MRVAVIGAGICGLYLARKLADRGEQITVFEKRDKIGKEVCSGLFSDRILEFIPESENLIENRIEYTLIHFPRKTLKVVFSRKFLVMNHEELDRLAAVLAEKAGARIILNTTRTVLEISEMSDFNRIVGCDGALSDTRRGLGLKDPQFYSGIQGFVKSRDRSDFVETWPTESGFIWKIPRGERTEWGIMEKPETAQDLFNDFLSKNSIHLESQKAWIIPQGLVIPQNSKITLCGDAAGLCKPWSGGGVIWGLTACDILLKNFPDFVKYQKEAKRFFGPKIALSKMAKKIIYFSGRNMFWFLPQNYKIESDFLI